MLTYDWPQNWKDREKEEVEDKRNKDITELLTGRRRPGREKILKEGYFEKCYRSNERK